MKKQIKFLLAFLGLVSGGLAAAKPVTAVLRLKERVSMEQLAAEVQDPSSLRYGRYYSPEEIRDLAAPAGYDDIVRRLRREGFKIVGESSTHLWVTVEAEKQVFESTFATQMREEDGGRVQLLQAQVPNRLDGVESVIGLDSTRKAHPKFHRLGVSSLASEQQPGGVAQAAIKTAYGFDPIYKAGWSGSGQHIAIATYDGFKITDVRKFYSLSKLKPVPKVDQVKFNGTPAYDEGSAGETELDAELSGMIAPGATVHVFASASNDDAGEAQIFTAILDDNRSKIVNYSWGSCEERLSPQHRDEMSKIFARALAQGVNILVASGDTGSDSCRNGTLVADWPAAHPSVVAVGGTSFVLNRAGALSETAWSGSGGGISSLFALPAWQQSLGGPYVRRSYPDVSFNADPQTGEAIYVQDSGKAQWIVVGGTSMAAPQWAGFLALVAQARASAHKSALGQFSPIIYGAPISVRATLFNDVTVGSNGAFSAAGNWDAVTGFGSMKADRLLTYLAGLQ